MTECRCRLPRRGPLYWDWRCLTCDGRIRFRPLRWFGR